MKLTAASGPLQPVPRSVRVCHPTKMARVLHNRSSKLSSNWALLWGALLHSYCHIKKTSPMTRLPLNRGNLRIRNGKRRRVQDCCWAKIDDSDRTPPESSNLRIAGNRPEFTRTRCFRYETIRLVIPLSMTCASTAVHTHGAVLLIAVGMVAAMPTQASGVNDWL